MTVLTGATAVVVAVVAVVSVVASELFFSSPPPQEVKKNGMEAPNNMRRNFDCFIDFDFNNS
jgi:hypothetical protein